MANIKISQLPVASVANSTDDVPINQGGVTKSVTVAQIISPEAVARLATDVSLQAQITNQGTLGATLASPVFTGSPKAPTKAANDNSTNIATTAYVDTADALRLRITGADTMTGALNMGTHKINAVVDPTSAQDAATKAYVDAADILKPGTLETYDPTGTSAFPTTWNSLSIVKGNRFYISVAGTMNTGAVVVQVGDLIEARVNAAGDLAASWAVIQANNVQATTSVIGITALATDAEAKAESSTTKAVTCGNLAALQASSIQTGLISIASQATVNIGTDDTQAVTAAKLQGKLNTAGITQSASLSITNAQILTLNSVPLTIVTAPGTGLAIEVVSASINYTYNSAVYTAITVGLKTDTASANQATSSTILSVASSTFCRIPIITSASIQLVANKALTVISNADGSAGGTNGSAVVYITYRIITI
jgi:hypothetical protein